MVKARKGRSNGAHQNAKRGMSADREAARLLSGLSDVGAHAFPGPTGGLILRRASSGVSLGGGAFSDAAGNELVAQDLARWERDGGRALLRITAPGRARLAREAADHDPFAAQHRDEARQQDEEGAPVRVNLAENPLDWLRRRQGGGLIDEAGFDAGDRLRRDLTIAAMLPSVTSRWDLTPRGERAPPDPGSASDRTLAARQRVRKALDAVGPDMAGMLVDVCGFLKGLQQVEAERGWPPRAGKVVLALALGRLAAHYGLRSQVRGPDRVSGTFAWRDAG